MAVDFDWQEGEYRDSLLPPPPPPRRDWRRAMQVVAGLLAVALVVVGVVFWRRASEGRRTAQADLQAVVDAELDAVQRGDEEVYLSLQDYRQRQWYRHQELYWDALQRAPEDEMGRQIDELHIADLDLGEESAWVEVEYELQEVPYRRVQFYRRVEGHWRRTPPDASYWGEKRELETAHVRYLYHEREEPIVLQLSKPLDDLFQQIATDFALDWTEQVVTFEFQQASQEGPALYSEAHFLVPSPLLLGVRADGRPDEELVASLGHSLALWMAIEKSGLYVRQPGPGSSWLVLKGIVTWEVEHLTARSPLPSRWLDWLDEAAAEESLLPLTALWPPYELHTERDGGLAAAQAQSIVAYAVHLQGRAVLPVLLETLGKKLSAAETIEQALGMDFADFEAGWQEFVEVSQAETAARPDLGSYQARLQEGQVSELLALSRRTEALAQRPGALDSAAGSRGRSIWLWTSPQGVTADAPLTLLRGLEMVLEGPRESGARIRPGATPAPLRGILRIDNSWLELETTSDGR